MWYSHIKVLMSSGIVVATIHGVDLHTEVWGGGQEGERDSER